MGLILPTDDVVGIAERVKFGDPVAGWRGDSTMDVYLDEERGEAAVFGFDGQGRRYCITRVALTNPGWRHDLLSRLKHGDWQRADAADRAIAKVDREIAERKATEDSLKDEFAERLAWAIRRDAGHLVGQSKDFY